VWVKMTTGGAAHHKAPRRVVLSTLGETDLVPARCGAL